ncbi:hypothetical protein SprV_0902776100 [Sparganum proliferum]
MEELTLEVRDLTRAVINTPSCGYYYGEYYSQPPPPPSLSQMTCVVANPLDTALLYVTRNLNERLRNLGNTMHHMIDQYPLPQGDQSSRGYRIEETTAARLLTVLQGNMKEAVRDLRTSLNRPMSRPHPLDQNPNRERLEISRLLADVVGLVGVIRKDFRDIVLGNNQILSQSVIRTTVNCPRPPSPQIYLDSSTIPAISVQQCPQSSEISKRTPVDLASDSAVEEPPMEADDPAKEIHFEHVPVQTGCSKVTEVMPSLPGKACMPLTHLMERPKANREGNQTRSVNQKCLRFARSSAVPPKYEKPKLSGLSGEKRLQQVTEKARPPFSASSSQSMSLEDDAPDGANSLPNDIPTADSRTVTAGRSSSSTEGCLPVRSLLNCLQRSDKHKEAPTSAPQLQNLEAKQTPVTLESEKSSGSQPSDNRSDDTKEKKQLTSEGTALKTSAHVPNETDEGIFSLEVDEAVAEITTSPQNGALRGDFHLEHPLKVQFLREIPADVNTLFCKQPNLTKGLLASEENCVEMPYTEVSSVLLPTECSGEDFEEEDAYLSSSPQTSEEENNTEDARARHHNSDVGEEGCAQGLEKIASAREQLVSILDLLDRSEQQEYSEEEFLRELKQLNLESDLPSTQGYYATSLPGSLPLLPEWNSTVVRLPPSTTPASASLRTATRISRSQTTTAVDGSHERGNWPTEGVGLQSNTEAEAMKRQSLQEPSVVGAKAGRSDSSDAPTPKDASPRTINDKNRQKYDERKRHPSLGLVEEARSHSVDETELNVGTDQPAAKESPQVEDSSNGRIESLREAEPSDLLSSYAEKRGKNEEGVSNDRLLVPEIKIANESSQGLPDAVTEKSNIDNLNRRRKHDSAVAAPISNEPVLRVIDCRPIPFLDKSTSVGNPTNCLPTLGSDSNVVCKAQCGNTLSQEILQDYYKLLAMAGRGAMTCHEWCPHKQPHLRNERQTYTCCCTGAVDDWRPICRPRAYGECSERQLDGTIYPDCDRRPCGIPDGCPPQCGTRRRQPEDSRQEFGPAFRRDCDNFLRVDLCGATGIQEAPDQKCFPCHEPPSQSDVMPHSSWRSAIPCRPVDMPPAVHRSSEPSSQREFDTNTVQTVDAQLMDVLERVESMVSTPFPPNRLLKDALAVVNASVDARRKVKAGRSSSKSFSSPDEGKRCGFQSKKPVPLARKRSSEYVNVWWLDSPVKVRRRRKRRGKLSRRAEVNELQIAKEKAAALSENSTDQLIQILDLLERRDRAETTDEEVLSEMQTAQCPQLDNPSTTACQTPSKPDASPAVRTESPPSCRCCSHLLTPQQPTNIVVLSPPQQYTHTDNYSRPSPHPFAAQSAASTSWPSVWPWTRQMGPPRAPAPWFTEPSISDWLSALLGDYGGLGGGGSKPLRITIREMTNNGAKEDEEGQ